jgi:hypothetical protein
MGFYINLFVPGHAVRPQFVGAPFMIPVSSLEYDGRTTGPVTHSDTFGLPEGPWTLYHLRSGPRAPNLWFHFPLPQPTQLILGANNTRIAPVLVQVFVLWSASIPAITLQEVVVFDGTTSLALSGPLGLRTAAPIPFNGPLTMMNGEVPPRASFALDSPSGVQFGLGVSARFTIDPAASDGILQFFGAGVQFFTEPSAPAASS